MSIAQNLLSKMRLPVIGAPLFIVSTPDLVINQCKAGIVGSFPSLNARPLEVLDEWLTQIKSELAAHDKAHPDNASAPFAMNLIVHGSNDRLAEDLKLCVKHEVPVVICSLGAKEEIYSAVHAYGGVVLHDVINQRFAHKAIEKGADGLVLVAAGAGGHAGVTSPFALVQETRQWFYGPIALSGSISSGASILAALAMGADFAYIGSPFIATTEANASDDYKSGVVDGNSADIVYSNLFTGVHGNYLKESILNSGLDPDNLPESDPSKMDFGSGGNTSAKAWKDIWGCGQGVGTVTEVTPVSDLINRYSAEYDEAKKRIV